MQCLSFRPTRRSGERWGVHIPCSPGSDAREERSPGLSRAVAPDVASAQTCPERGSPLSRKLQPRGGRTAVRGEVRGRPAQPSPQPSPGHRSPHPGPVPAQSGLGSRAGLAGILTADVTGCVTLNTVSGPQFSKTLNMMRLTLQGICVSHHVSCTH